MCLLSALTLLLTLLHEFHIGGKALAVRSVYLQRTALEFEADAQARTHPAGHGLDLFQRGPLSLPAAELPGVWIIQVILVDAVALVKAKLARHHGDSIPWRADFKDHLW